MSKFPFRFGIIGAGAIAQAYATSIEQIPHVALTAVCDMDLANAARMAQGHGAEVFSSHRDMIDAQICDGVLVATPPVTHAPIVVELLSKKMPVLCEKPLSVDLESAKRMINAAEDQDTLLSMASKFRFSDDVIKARDLIRDGAIGTPLMLENTFTGVVDMTSRWNSDKTVSGGGVLIDNGTHSVDIIRFLVGPIEDVFAVPAPRIQNVDVEDGVTLLARTETGVEAKVETSWSIHKDRTAAIEVYGTTGAIEVGWKSSRIRRQHGGAWEEFGSGYDKIASFRRQVEHFVGALGGDQLELVDTEDALASVSAIQAAYASIQSGTWVKVGTGTYEVPKFKLA